jgi:spore coat polysaccharide biosynthesis predicted glycosyltransferase SpsG
LSKNQVVAIEPGVSVVEIACEYDFVISACGVTAWEILSSKIPCVLIGGAENQRNQLEYFINLNIAEGLMFEDKVDFVGHFSKILDRFSLSKSSQKIFNGRARAVDWMENL